MKTRKLITIAELKKKCGLDARSPNDRLMAAIYGNGDDLDDPTLIRVLDKVDECFRLKASRKWHLDNDGEFEFMLEDVRKYITKNIAALEARKANAMCFNNNFKRSLQDIVGMQTLQYYQGCKKFFAYDCDDPEKVLIPEMSRKELEAIQEEDIYKLETCTWFAEICAAMVNCPDLCGKSVFRLNEASKRDNVVRRLRDMLNLAAAVAKELGERQLAIEILLGLNLVGAISEYGNEESISVDGVEAAVNQVFDGLLKLKSTIEYDDIPSVKVAIKGAKKSKKAAK